MVTTRVNMNNNFKKRFHGFPFIKGVISCFWLFPLKGQISGHVLVYIPSPFPLWEDWNFSGSDLVHHNVITYFITFSNYTST